LGDNLSNLFKSFSTNIGVESSVLGEVFVIIIALENVLKALIGLRI